MAVHRTPGFETILAERLVSATASKIGDAIDSKDIDTLVAEVATSMQTIDTAYGSLATRLEVDAIYSEAEECFSLAMERARDAGKISRAFMDIVNRNKRQLNSMVVSERDTYFSYSALRTLRASYLIHDEGQLIERPQYVWLRAAVQMHLSDMDNVQIAYDMMSCFKYIPEPQVLVNSGTFSPGMSSCQIIQASGDADGIFRTLDKALSTCRSGTGVGLGMQYIPAKGSMVGGVERTGVLPALKMFDASMDVINTTKRSGSIAAFLEVWHADIATFVKMKRNSGPEEDRARKLEYGVVINNIFMNRVQDNKSWTLFCPTDAFRLVTAYGSEFDTEYQRLESLGVGRSTVKARELWVELLKTQSEHGEPSILFKDAINAKSNQSHMGAITHSSLCADVVQYADEREPASCSLASVVLPQFVMDKGFNFTELGFTVRHLVVSMNHLLNHAHYPNAAVKASTFKHRAIGIGIQGLGDTFALMGYSYDSEDARRLNTEISETIYYNAMDESCNMIKTLGAHPSFSLSPAAAGWLQIDCWSGPRLSERYDWGALRQKVVKGVCNSLVTVYMPTKESSLLTGYSEGTSPIVSHVHTQSVLTGRYPVVSKYLMKILEDLDLWTEDLRNKVIANNGSVQNIEAIPLNIREVHKTVWEIDSTRILQMAIDRAPFICQSESMIIYLDKPSISELTQLLFMGWRGGLKTGMYRLQGKTTVDRFKRTQGVADGNTVKTQVTTITTIVLFEVSSSRGFTQYMYTVQTYVNISRRHEHFETTSNKCTTSEDVRDPELVAKLKAEVASRLSTSTGVVNNAGGPVFAHAARHCTFSGAASTSAAPPPAPVTKPTPTPTATTVVPANTIATAATPLPIQRTSIETSLPPKSLNGDSPGAHSSNKPIQPTRAQHDGRVREELKSWSKPASRARRLKGVVRWKVGVFAHSRDFHIIRIPLSKIPRNRRLSLELSVLRWPCWCDSGGHADRPGARYGYEKSLYGVEYGLAAIGSETRSHSKSRGWNTTCDDCRDRERDVTWSDSTMTG
ncbi:hypothetical protein D9611_012995 [Ephemerocybe angulata]|uniref:Ribonucleoside-diphosphate reductase n=1 Tax=Ephemerocybe angulata TaxID=980116 RepID=A0A8H5ESV6_9AGAR|nr:hypothetical protein D9611_012995 [Tulosesus angulatus]